MRPWNESDPTEKPKPTPEPTDDDIKAVIEGMHRVAKSMPAAICDECNQKRPSYICPEPVCSTTGTMCGECFMRHMEAEHPQETPMPKFEPYTMATALQALERDPTAVIGLCQHCESPLDEHSPNGFCQATDVEHFQKWVRTRPDGGVHASPADCFNAGRAIGSQEAQDRFRKSIPVILNWKENMPTEVELAQARDDLKAAGITPDYLADLVCLADIDLSNPDAPSKKAMTPRFSFPHDD